ncbi:MAG: hypothetical protein KDD60_04470, partial [Bdellovibrionales bacterium]|nr:hypothetical protein [Bdellovibrionales bacterium]
MSEFARALGMYNVNLSVRPHLESALIKGNGFESITKLVDNTVSSRQIESLVHHWRTKLLPDQIAESILQLNRIPNFDRLVALQTSVRSFESSEATATFQRADWPEQKFTVSLKPQVLVDERGVITDRTAAVQSLLDRMVYFSTEMTKELVNFDGENLQIAKSVLDFPETAQGVAASLQGKKDSKLIEFVELINQHFQHVRRCCGREGRERFSQVGDPLNERDRVAVIERLSLEVEKKCRGLPLAGKFAHLYRKALLAEWLADPEYDLELHARGVSAIYDRESRSAAFVLKLPQLCIPVKVSVAASDSPSFESQIGPTNYFTQAYVMPLEVGGDCSHKTFASCLRTIGSIFNEVLGELRHNPHVTASSYVNDIPRERLVEICKPLWGQIKLLYPVLEELLPEVQSLDFQGTTDLKNVSKWGESTICPAVFQLRDFFANLSRNMDAVSLVSSEDRKNVASWLSRCPAFASEKQPFIRHIEDALDLIPIAARLETLGESAYELNFDELQAEMAELGDLV